MLVVPYQEDLKPPTQHYSVFEKKKTDFLHEFWMSDKNSEGDYIKDFRKTLLRLSTTEMRFEPFL